MFWLRIRCVTSIHLLTTFINISFYSCSIWKGGSGLLKTFPWKLFTSLNYSYEIVRKRVTVRNKQDIIKNSYTFRHIFLTVFKQRFWHLCTKYAKCGILFRANALRYKTWMIYSPMHAKCFDNVLIFSSLNQYC
jgi:hypothetical protein